MRVPEYQQSVSQQGLPDARQTTHYTADDFMGGTQKAALGYGVELAGNLANDAQKVAVKHYEDQLKQARDARVLDANTQMMTHVQDAMYGENGALNKTGEAAFLGSDGKTVSDIAYDDMVKQQQSISDTLGDDEQKAMFNAHSMPMLTTMRQQLMNHEAESHRVYVKSTLEANNAAQVSNIDHNYNDNDGMRKSIDQINKNSAQLALTNGQGAEAGAVIAQTHISGALNNVINSALDRNDATSIPTAMNIMQHFAKDMNQDDLVAGYAKIASGKRAMESYSASFNAIQQVKPILNPTDSDRLNNLISGAESGNMQWKKDGSIVTSPKGAIGRWQVMPDTGPEAAKLAGLEWNPELFNQKMTGNPVIDGKASQYNEALGKAYFQEQLQVNNGDQQKALAAYNAGPGALKKAIADGGDNWLSMLPTETQAYVGDITTRLQNGEGKPKPATLKDTVEIALASLPVGATVEQMKDVEIDVTHRFGLEAQAINDHVNANVNEAMGIVEANKGDLSKVPQSLRASIPNDKWAHVETYAGQKGGGPEKSDLALYNRLTENDTELMKLSPDEFVALKSRLTNSDWHSLQTQRDSIRNPSAEKSPNNLDSSAVTSSLNNALDSVQIPRGDGKNVDHEHLGAIRQYVNTQLLWQQNEEGKHFTEKEINNRILGFFAKGVLTKHYFSSDKNETLLSKNTKDIPSDARESLKSSFAKKGISNPTDGQLLLAYYTLIGKQDK